MSKKSVLMCILSAVMIAWFCYALPVTARMASQAHLSGVDVVLSDPDSRFVNVADVLVEAGIDPDTIDRCLISNYDLRSIEARLKASDKLQDANVTLGTNGKLHIDVTPMVPVARVFDPAGPSYYINASGKSISAELRYHIDVPVLVGHFDSIYPAKRLLPLLDYIAGDSRAGALVATVTQQSDGNIILVPTIVGHVINFGDTSLVEDKFNRLRAFYRYVAPTQGWLSYDTIAVKWRDQVVATRRDKAPAPVMLPTEEEQTGILDIDDNEPHPDDDLSQNNAPA